MEEEMVRLSINKMVDGVVYCREFAFMADHQVFWRVTNLDTMESSGWSALPNWRDPAQIKLLVQQMEAKGWTAVWNPKYTLSAEYIRSVSFLN